MDATTESVTIDVNAEKAMDWAISSRADEKSPEGSTTRRGNLRPSAEVLREMYKEMTTRQIATKLDIGSRTAARWLHEAGIRLRKVGQSPNHEPLLDAAWLRDRYAVQETSAERLAKELGCTPSTVVRALRAAGLEVRRTNLGRKFPEVGARHREWLKGRFCGDKNPNWRGGAVRADHRARNSKAARTWAELVKERDGWKCVKCSETGHLHAHHVVSWSRDKAKRFDVSNGLTLCIPCHQKEHSHEFAGFMLGKVKRPRARDASNGDEIV